jgi:hypothetical protein
LPAPSVTEKETHDKQEHYGADRGVDDGTDQSSTEVESKLREQPASDKGTHDSGLGFNGSPNTAFAPRSDQALASAFEQWQLRLGEAEQNSSLEFL